MLAIDWHVGDQNDNFEQRADPFDEVVVRFLLEKLDFFPGQIVHLSVDALAQNGVQH